MEVDPDAPEFVAKQRIEFLVLMKTVGNDKLPWGFPTLPVLQELFNFVREACDHDLIMDVALWVRAVSYTHLTLPTIYSV